MKFRDKLKWLLIGLTPFLVLVIIGVIFVISIDYKEEIPRIQSYKMGASDFDIEPYLEHLDSVSLEKDFPYDVFLDSAHYKDISLTIYVLERLNNAYPGNKHQNMRVLTQALTERLQIKIQSDYIEFKPEKLLRLLQWAERFDLYGDLQPKQKRMHKTIYNHWMDFISTKLGEYYQSDENIKYDFMFKYLSKRCLEHSFVVTIGKNNYEKALDHFASRNFPYLLNRFWIATSLQFKLLILIILVITIVSYIIMIRQLFLRIKSRSK